MKTLILFLSIMAISTAAIADDTKYEVTIKVVYNAVSIEEANAIMSKATEQHKSACKTEVAAKKIESDAVHYMPSSLILYDAGDTTTSCYDIATGEEVPCDD